MVEPSTGSRRDALASVDATEAKMYDIAVWDVLNFINGDGKDAFWQQFGNRVAVSQMPTSGLAAALDSIEEQRKAHQEPVAFILVCASKTFSIMSPGPNACVMMFDSHPYGARRGKSTVDMSIVVLAQSARHLMYSLRGSYGEDSLASVSMVVRQPIRRHCCNKHSHLDSSSDESESVTVDQGPALKHPSARAVANSAEVTSFIF